MDDLLGPAEYGEEEEDGEVSSSVQHQLVSLIGQERDSKDVDEPTSSSTPRYSCKYCDYRTDKKSNHDSHTKFVHLKARDSCPECGKQIANLNQHLRVSHKIFKSSKSEQTCPMCEKQFLNLESHMQKAHNVKTQSEHVCEVCFKVFSKKDHLVRHENIVHKGLRQMCHICNKEFSNLDKHLKTKHSLEGSQSKVILLPCDYCSQTFTKKSDLNSHKEASHAMNNPEKKFCNICFKQFSNLAQHHKIVHSKVKNFKCLNCQKGFYDNRELMRHQIKFLKTSECKKEVTQAVCKYHCTFDNCEYKTNKKGNMAMHKESVHLNIKYNCPECNKTLSSRANLNSHVKNVHDKKIVNGSLQGDPNKQKFPCKLCEYTTNRVMHLDRHMLSVHSAAAFETVDQVYQASQAREPETPRQQVPVQQPSSPRYTAAQLASLMQVDEAVQYLVQDSCNNLGSTAMQVVERRTSSDLLSLPPGHLPGHLSASLLNSEEAFQLVDSLPSIYFV